MSETTETPEPATSQGMGMVKGVPGENVQGIGMLDLRGVSPEEILKLKRVQGAGAILVDEGQRSALSHCHIEGVGAIVEIGADEKVLMQPLVEFSTATLSAMTPSQRMTIIGIMYFEANVPSALVQEKIEQLRLIGVLIAPHPVLGALFGRLDHIGPAITINEGSGPVIRRIGDVKMTPGLLANLPMDATYINIGVTRFTADVDPAEVATHIAHYHNIGETEGSQAVIDLLQARSSTDVGHFSTLSED